MARNHQTSKTVDNSCKTVDKTLQMGKTRSFVRISPSLALPDMGDMMACVLNSRATFQEV